MVKARLDDPLSADQLRSLLDYAPKTGIFTWRARKPVRQYDRSWNTRYAGKQAGTPTTAGYVQILVDGHLYLAHRLAFLWMTGEWPPEQIDHRDSTPSNNAWRNIRPATESQNRMNSQIRSDNTSGYKGVWFDKRRNHWVAEIMAEGRKLHIGYFPTSEAAAVARMQAAHQHHGIFAR